VLVQHRHLPRLRPQRQLLASLRWQLLFLLQGQGLFLILLLPQQPQLQQ
jgi:hypothetical protein